MPVDVVIVGGGPIGLASAWRAAQAGLDVVVCDPAPGSGAADVAAGMIAAVSEAWFGEETLGALTVESAARWPSFATELEKESEQLVGFTEGGTLLAAYDADDLAVVDRLIGLHHDLGLAVERLRAAELRGREPALAPSVRGGAAVAIDHRVDPRALCAALLTACDAAGVLLRQQHVERIDVSDGTATGVTTADGSTIAASAVVLAAGCWSGSINGLPPAAAPPVRPVKGEVLTVRNRPGAPPLVEHAVRGYVRGSTVYLVPRDDGRVVVGATSEERGFDTTVTAGCVYRLLRDATSLIPGLDDAELVEARAGLRPGTADNAPLIGRVDVDGLIIATGHYRNGILLTPITADAVLAMLTGNEVPTVVGLCDPRRFGRR
jgi:glycine oxidase